MKLPHTEVKFYPEMKSQTDLNSLQVSCKRAHSVEVREIMADSANKFNFWVESSDDSKAYRDFRDSKIGRNWLETHVYISKYCLQIEKCNNIECCQPMRSNVQEVLGGKFLPAPLALSGGPYLIDPCKKDEKKIFFGFH